VTPPHAPARAIELTAQCEVGTLERILLKHPRDAFLSQERIAAEWEDLRYLGPPDLARAVEEYDRLLAVFQGLGVRVDLLPPAESVGLDSLYVRDASVTTDQGVVLCRMGKAARRGEPPAQAAALRTLGIPILGEITGEGCLEGGDVVWLDRRTLAVGRGYRTNDEGIRQLRALVRDEIDRLIVVPLPHHRGPDDVFHLMSILSPVDHDLALVHSPLMPVPFRQALLERGMQLVEVPAEELDSKGPNVLALAPRKVLAVDGSPVTRRRLEEAGVEVIVFNGAEISHKGCGGPTCLARPLLRRA
jgi:N-dimethylarginine dimethylaminohydrolase